MKTSLITAFATIVIVAPAAGQNATRQTCEGRDPVGYLGISGISCNCTVTAPTSARPWSFRTEPKVTSLELDSPAGKLLKTGDVITHVNGKLITTSEGAQELARLRPGEAVVLTVRRGRETLKYALTADSACPTDTRLLGIYAPVSPRGVASVTPSADRTPRPAAAAGASGVAPKAQQSMRRRASFGMSLSCGGCSIEFRDKDNVTIMSFSQPPEVYSVERGGPADRAGIRRGDVITHVNGRALDTDEGGRLIANARPGELVTLTVRRGADRKDMRVQAAERTTPLPQLAQSSASLEKARASLNDLQRDQAIQLKRIEEELRQSRRVEAEKLREMQREMVRNEQDHRRKLSELARELSSAQSRMRAAMADSMRAVCAVASTTSLLPGASRTLRYSGTIGATEIEVRGASPVSVSESGNEIEITAGATVVKLKSSKKN